MPCGLYLREINILLLRIRVVVDYISLTCRLLRKNKYFLLLVYVTCKWSFFRSIMEKAEVSYRYHSTNGHLICLLIDHF